MKSSFAAADSESVPAAPEADLPTAASTGPAPSTDTRVAAPADAQVVADNFFSNDGVTGDFDEKDIKMPRLALVQSVGPLSAELGFIPGTFVYNKEVEVGTRVVNPQANNVVIGTDGLELTLVRINKYFLEDLPYTGGGEGPMPKFFRTLDDARKDGFLPIQDKRQMGEEHQYVKPVLDADVLIKGDADRHAAFPFDFNGIPFAIARWTLQSTAYSRVGKQFFTDSQLALKVCGLKGKFYAVSSRREKLGQNFVFVPKAQIKGINSPEFIAWANSVTQKKQQAA